MNEVVALNTITMIPMRVPAEIAESDDRWLIDPDFSAVEGVPRRYWKVENDQVVEMTQGEKDAVDAGLVPGEVAGRIAHIDERTQELIFAGFDHDSQHFSLSLAAQQNWTRLKIWQLSGTISYPIEISTSDDGRYSIVDETALEAFFSSMNVAINTRIAEGRTLKDQVAALTTLAEIEAWEDPR